MVHGTTTSCVKPALGMEYGVKAQDTSWILPWGPQANSFPGVKQLGGGRDDYWRRSQIGYIQCQSACIDNLNLEEPFLL
jgi:hypothetical protein